MVFFFHFHFQSYTREFVCVCILLLKSGRCLRVSNLQKVGALIKITDNKISDFLFYFGMIELKQKYMYINRTSKKTEQRTLFNNSMNS